LSHRLTRDRAALESSFDSSAIPQVDKVKGVVWSNRPDNKNALYQQTIKQGDALLNRIQKLSRVITI
jgi:hypothetical protein